MATFSTQVMQLDRILSHKLEEDRFLLGTCCFGDVSKAVGLSNPTIWNERSSSSAEPCHFRNRVIDGKQRAVGGIADGGTIRNLSASRRIRACTTGGQATAKAL